MKYKINKKTMILYFDNKEEFAKISFNDLRESIINKGFKSGVCILVVGGITVASINTNNLILNTNMEENNHNINENEQNSKENNSNINENEQNPKENNSNINENEQNLKENNSNINKNEQNGYEKDNISVEDNAIDPKIYKISPSKLIDVEIKENLLPVSSKKIGGLNNVKYIVVHNTANSASAKNEVQYLHNPSNTSYTSFHYAVDENEVWQGIDERYFGYHAGDTYYNKNSIGVEIARSVHEDIGIRDRAIENGAKLIAKLLNNHNLSVDKLISHQDASGKFCPHDIYERYGWDSFIEEVEYYLNLY